PRGLRLCAKTIIGCVVGGFGRSSRPAPIFFGLTLDRRRRRILDLEPVIDPSRAVRRAEPLRDNAFATKRAGMLVDAGAVADEVLIECDAVTLSRQQIGQGTLAFLERCMTQVFAVQLNQIESAEHGGMVVTPGAQQVEGGETALVDHN